MTTFILTRTETAHAPAARCTFEQEVSSNGTKWINVSHEEFWPSMGGWVGTMGKGSGIHSVKHAREMYQRMLDRGYTAA